MVALFIRTICRLRRDRRWDMTLRYRISIQGSITLFRVQWDSPEQFLSARHAFFIRSFSFFHTRYSSNIFSRGVICSESEQISRVSRFLITHNLRILIGYWYYIKKIIIYIRYYWTMSNQRLKARTLVRHIYIYKKIATTSKDTLSKQFIRSGRLSAWFTYLNVRIGDKCRQRTTSPKSALIHFAHAAFGERLFHLPRPVHLRTPLQGRPSPNHYSWTRGHARASWRTVNQLFTPLG